LEPNLHPSLGQVDLKGELLAEKHVGVVGAVEGPLQFLQLKRIERRPAKQNLSGSFTCKMKTVSGRSSPIAPLFPLHFAAAARRWLENDDGHNHRKSHKNNSFNNNNYDGRIL
jgi:hypothetical protein